MKRIFNIIIIAAVALFVAVSCRRIVEIDSVEKGIFMDETEIGCYKDGHDYLVYDPLLHQLALNPKRHTLRLQTDKQMEFYHIDMESYPRTVGVTILADIHMMAGRESMEFTMAFECSKMESGKIWLWNKESKLGVIIPMH